MKKTLPAFLFLGLKGAGLSAPVRSGRGLFYLAFWLFTGSLFAQTNRTHVTIQDSLFKKHGKRDNVLITSSGSDAVSSIFLYKKARKWKGVLFADASIVNIVDGLSCYIHKITVKPFDADTIGPKLYALGIENLKQYSQHELAIFYAKKMKEVANAAIEYDLPNCSHPGLFSITYKGKTISYTDCYSYSKELQELPEMKNFFAITSFVLIQTYIKLNPKK